MRNRRPGGEAVMVGNLRPHTPRSRFKLLTRSELNPSNASLVSLFMVVVFRDSNREIWYFRRPLCEVIESESPTMSQFERYDRPRCHPKKILIKKLKRFVTTTENGPAGSKI